MAAPNTVNTEKQQSGLIPYEKGQSGNPLGRPIGARNRFSGAFLEDLSEVWDLYGKPAMIKMAEEHPKDFVRCAALVLPKDTLLPELGDGKVTITWEL